MVMKEDVRGASAVVAIIAMIIGGLVGFAFGINDDGSTTTLITEGKTQIDTPAPKLQQDITLSFGEYYSHVFQLLTQSYDDSESQKTAILIAEVDDISEEHVSLIAKTFGIDQDEYLTEIRNMNGLYVDYAKALSKNSENITDLEDSINKSIDSRVTLFAENINISSEDFRNGFQRVNQSLLGYINEYDASDFEVAFAKQRESYGEIKSLANRLTRAAVAQFPEKYTIDKEDNTKE